MATKKTAAAQASGDEAPAPISVADLPDGRVGQVTEASLEPKTFTMGDGSQFTFAPSAEWNLETAIAFTNGQIGTWLGGALQDRGDLGKIAKRPAREVGRIMRYFDDQMGVSRGESPGSSDS